MEDQKIVSYIAFEGEMTRLERMNHRLFILCLALLVALVASNAGWIWYNAQFEDYEETYQEVTQSAESENGDAVNRFVGGDNVESNSDD